jgi:hypothetical protein
VVSAKTAALILQAFALLATAAADIGFSHQLYRY